MQEERSIANLIALVEPSIIGCVNWKNMFKGSILLRRNILDVKKGMETLLAAFAIKKQQQFRKSKIIIWKVVILGSS